MSGFVVNARCASPGEASASIAISIDGRNWPDQATQTGVSEVTPLILDAAKTGAALESAQQLYVRFTMENPGGPGARPNMLDSLSFACAVKPPDRKEIVLQPRAKGDLYYFDDFETSQWMHTADVSGDVEFARWSPGSFGLRGAKGKTTNWSMQQKFVLSDNNMKKLTIKLSGNANHRDLGGAVSLGLSRDGQNIMLIDNSGKHLRENQRVYNGELVIELPGKTDLQVPTLGEFFLHLTMRNVSGAQTNESSTIRSLEIIGQ